METNELKKIWTTLANNKLINKELAKENILQIITKKGNGIISKMKRKIKIDYYIYLSGLIFLPVIALIVFGNLQTPFPKIRPIIGLSFFELFLILLIIKSLRNINVLNFSFNSGSIKESLIKVKSHFESHWEKEYWIILLFGLSFLIFVLIHFLLIIGGIKHITFSTGGFNMFASYFSVFILILIIIWPFILKIQSKSRFSGILGDINQIIKELDTETE